MPTPASSSAVSYSLSDYEAIAYCQAANLEAAAAEREDLRRSGIISFSPISSHESSLLSLSPAVAPLSSYGGTTDGNLAPVPRASTSKPSHSTSSPAISSPSASHTDRPSTSASTPTGLRHRPRHASSPSTPVAAQSTKDTCRSPPAPTPSTSSSGDTPGRKASKFPHSQSSPTVAFVSSGPAAPRSSQSVTFAQSSGKQGASASTGASIRRSFSLLQSVQSKFDMSHPDHSESPTDPSLATSTPVLSDPVLSLSTPSSPGHPPQYDEVLSISIPTDPLMSQVTVSHAIDTHSPSRLSASKVALGDEASSPSLMDSTLYIPSAQDPSLLTPSQIDPSQLTPSPPTPTMVQSQEPSPPETPAPQPPPAPPTIQPSPGLLSRIGSFVVRTHSQSCAASPLVRH